MNGSTMKVVLDNVDDPASNGATALTLALGATFTSATRENLTASSLTATSRITLGGQSVQTTGTLGAPSTTPVTERAYATGSANSGLLTSIPWQRKR
ncbi:MAG TPA: glycosyl hydrolase family 79 C-terminal domain-containing protein [Pseudonocardiaceae bacterium]